jgi:hypothetical protein
MLFRCSACRISVLTIALRGDVGSRKLCEQWSSLLARGGVDGLEVLMGSRSSCYASFMESRPALGIDGIVLKELTNNHWGGGKSGGPQKVV